MWQSGDEENCLWIEEADQQVKYRLEQYYSIVRVNGKIRISHFEMELNADLKSIPFCKEMHYCCMSGVSHNIR